MLKAIYHTFHHRKLPLVFLLYQMPTKVVQEFQNRSSWHEKGSVQYIYLKKEENGEKKECQVNKEIYYLIKQKY